MSQMSPALDAAFAGQRVTAFAAIELALPDRTVRLIVGSGFVTFGGNTYVARDDGLGVFSDIEQLDDGTGDEAPGVTLTFIPPTDAATAQIASPQMQGSKVKISLGAVDPVTGQSIGDPLLIFSGLLDVPTIRVGKEGRKVDYEITSIFEDFFIADEGARLSHGFHQYLWPDELGCEFVTYVTHQEYWGQETPDGVSQ